MTHLEWSPTTVGFDESAWTATDASGKQYVLIFDDENNPCDVGWIIQTIEFDEDNLPVVGDCGILNADNLDDIETAMREAEEYLKV